MIIQVMQKKSGHAQYVVEQKKNLQRTLSEIEELQPGHVPKHMLTVKMRGVADEQQVTMSQLLKKPFQQVEKVLVRPVVTAG